nr:oligosaccharide flippase family protein [uncultured Draconibacterium sp.]
MLKDIKKATKHTSVYAIGSIATKLIGLVLIPLYTDADYLSHSDYGALAVLEATSQFLIGILTMAMVQSLTRWYWDNQYKEVQNTVFFTTLFFLIVTLIPVGGILVMLSDKISYLLFDSEKYSFLLKLTIAASLLQIINNQILCLAKLQTKSLLYISIQIFKLTLTLGLILWGILYKGLGLTAIWQATLWGEAVSLFLFIPYTVKNSKLSLQFSILREMLEYGFPLMLASVSGVLLATMDRYMLSSMSSLEKTGIYSLGFKIANTLKVVITTSLGLALSPLKMKRIGHASNQRLYSKINTYSSFIFIVSLIALSLFSLELIKVFSGSKIYWQANSIVPIISFSLLFGLMKDNTLIGLNITKKTKIIGSLIFVTSLINIGLNILLIPTFDIFGAAFATLISQVFFFSSVTYFAQKAYPIPYEWKKIGLMIGLASVIVLVGILISETALIWRLVIKSLLLITFPFILYFFSFYEKVEIENIKRIVNNWRNPKKLRENIKRFIN